MRVFNFKLLKQHLVDIEDQARSGNVVQIEIHARLLSEDLEGYARPIQPRYKTGTGSLPPVVINHGSDVCREMADSIRAAQREAKSPTVALRHIMQAIQTFEASDIYPRA